MDRILAYTGALPQTTDPLSNAKNALVGLGYGLQSVMGTPTAIDGLVCSPTTPVADLHVTVGPGSITSVQPVDSTAYSDLGTDTHSILKQGLLLDAVILLLTPPSTAGYSQVYLVQAEYADQDTGATVLNYYNAANPSQPYSGPSNSGMSQFTIRKGACIVALKAGAAATTGTQATPSPDAGYVGLYAITVANGATQITSANIARVAGAPFVDTKLPQVPAAVQAGGWLYAVGTGTGAAIAATFAPVPTGLPDGMELHVKAPVAAQGSDTFNPNGLGALPIARRGAGTTAANDWAAGDILCLRKNGSVWSLAGLVPSDVAAQLTTLNISNVGAANYAYYTGAGSFTWPCPAGVTKVRAKGRAGGGGGGGANGARGAGAGGNAGAYFEGVYAVTPGTNYAITIGGGGTGGPGGGNGSNGGNTSFASFAAAYGGAGGGGGAGTGGSTGAGTTASGGSINIGGASGQYGLAVNAGPTGIVKGGDGGAGALGPASTVWGTTTADNPGYGNNLGGGGSGGSTIGGAASGGAGGSGYLILEF